MMHETRMYHLDVFICWQGLRRILLYLTNKKKNIYHLSTKKHFPMVSFPHKNFFCLLIALYLNTFMGEIQMEKNTSIAIVFSSIIIGGSLMYGTTKISNSIDNAGMQIANSNFQMDDSINGNYELVVIDGWLYLYDSTSGQIWKKADNDNPDETWETVKYFGE